MEASNSKSVECIGAHRETSDAGNENDEITVGKSNDHCKNGGDKIGVDGDCSAESLMKNSVSSSQTNPTSQNMVPSKETTGDDDRIEEDDVPGDFFDDFLKEDFMAGLDIVDEDEWDEEKEKQVGGDSSEGSRMRKKRVTKDQKVQKQRTDRDDLRRKLKEKVRDDDGDLRRKLKDMQEARKSKKPEKINADEFDIRRDPDKTRRDIKRDKLKCEKDKEQKIISEKLKLVETGLIPPGMEMETDLEEIKKQNKVVRNETVRSAVTVMSSSENPSSKKISSSPRKQKTKSPRRHSSPKKVSSSRRSPRRISKSPNRRSPLRRRTPVRRSPLRHSPLRHSPLRRRSRDRNQRRSLDRSLRRSMERVRRSRSPVYRTDRYNKYSSRHKRSRSRSPNRRREADKKKSFLEEIAEKLNETRPVKMIPYQPMSTYTSEIYNIAPHLQPLPINPVPAPAPVPPPITPHYQSNPKYDQNFFIGTPQPKLNDTNSLNAPVSLSSVQTQLNDSSNYRHNLQSVQVQADAKTKDDVAKLFQDKKITLTEFLAITAKPEVYSASPAHMKEKIKVISRCQEAIKFLGLSEKKFTGPLVIRKGQRPKQASEEFISPLIRSSHLKLPFTEIPDNEQQCKDFTTYINNLLENLGLLNDVIVIEDSDPVHRENYPSACAPPPPPLISTRNVNHNLSQFETRQLHLDESGFKQVSKQVQTEGPKCIDCDTRKRIVYKTVGTQCGNDGISFSVGTQVKEDDFFGKLPKTQSLASLTPAQLLGKTGVSKPGEFDSFPLKNVYRPPGYTYGSEPFGANRFIPPGYTPQPPSRPFEPPNAAGMRGPRERDMWFNNNY